MKKTLSLILAAVVVLSAIIALASCGKSTIDGEWKTDLDLAKMLGGEDTGLDLTGKTVAIELNLKTDGKCVLSIDEAQFKSVMTDVYKASFEAAASMLGGTVDDYVALLGASSLDEAVKMMVDDMDPTEAQEGEYKFENDVLTINGTSFKVDFSGSKLVLKELVSGEESEMLSSSALPITFTRK